MAPTSAEREDIEVACRGLVLRYADALDRHDVDALLEVFVPDLLWERPGMRVMRSHAEVRLFFQQFWSDGAATRHWFDVHARTTCCIEVENGQRVLGSSWCVMYSAPGSGAERPAVMPGRPELIVLYRDVFVPTAAGWRIAEHRARHLLRSPEYRGPEIPASFRRQAIGPGP